MAVEWVLTSTMARRRTAAPKRSKARARRARRLRMPALGQRELDLIGLSLLSGALFIGFVLYGGWDGGRVGEAIAAGLELLIGRAAALAPLALAAAGGVLVLRPVLPRARPLRVAALCLLAGLTLALAAGTAGLGPEQARADYWQRDIFEVRGGLLGEALLWVAATLFSDLGAHMIALFLLAVGVLLASGTSLASLAAAASARLGAGLRVLRAAARWRPARRTTVELSLRGPPVPVPSDEPDQDLVEQAGALAHAEPEPTGVSALGDDDEPQEPGTVARREAPDAADLTPQGRFRVAVTDAPDFLWRAPSAKLLKRSTAEQGRPDTAGQEKVAAQLVEALGHFGVEAKITGMVAGPHVTRYELRLAPGIKVAKVAQLKDDLAYALAATDVRILAPIPGKRAVGVEVPNARRRIVHLGDVFGAPPPDWSPLTVWLGKDVSGRAIGADLARMPHLLVAGTTGAGKSGCVNAMLASILLRATPHDVRLVLVDPKQVELNHYESIPHLLTPVITNPRRAANALGNLVREMEQRYSLMSLARTRSLVELNRSRVARSEAPLPYILCVIDELADLMMVAPADVEDSIIRLAQKARAVGIHLVLATQSPRVDVITGMIKANVPSRIAFAVSSQTDSRVILDQNGAESLLGQGDMLFSPVGTSRLQRIQGAYVDEAQIAKLTEAWRKQGEPELREELLEEVEPDEGSATGAGADGFDPDEDPLLEDAIALVAQMGTASTSMLQRRLRLGYTRAGRLIDMLERRGVISGYEGSKPRQVLIGEGDVARVLATLGGSVRAVDGGPVAALAPGDGG